MTCQVSPPLCVQLNASTEMAGGSKAEEEASVLLLMELSVLTASDNRVEEDWCNVRGVCCEIGSNTPQECTGPTHTTACISRETSSDDLQKHENDGGCCVAAMVFLFLPRLRLAPFPSRIFMQRCFQQSGTSFITGTLVVS